MSTLLNVTDLHTSYGKIHALKGVNITVNEGEIISLVGSNGAGKSTLLSTISGTVKSQSGEIYYQDKNIVGLSQSEIVKLGISLSPEGRGVFPRLSVEENLRLGAYTRKNKVEIKQSFNDVYELFPRLKERKKQLAGTMSGGEQQMLAIGRALMSKPRLLLLDEPSLGLAPNLVKLIFELIVNINRQGISILLIEQNAKMALKISDRGYVLESGKVKLTDRADNLLNIIEVRNAYLGELIHGNVDKNIIHSLNNSKL